MTPTIAPNSAAAEAAGTTAAKRAIIVGASSGIGRELAIVLSEAGWSVGLMARRQPELEETSRLMATPGIIAIADIADVESAQTRFAELVAQLGGVDLVVLSSGVGFLNPELSWPEEQQTIAVNVTGCAALATAAFREFERAGCGHLVGISSIAAIRGGSAAPAYGASKAFLSNYLEALRCRAIKKRLPIAVTDIQPGFVDTAMAKGEGKFWVAPPQVAARQIYAAILRRSRHAYVTRRWRLIAWLVKLLPESLYARM